MNSNRIFLKATQIFLILLLFAGFTAAHSQTSESQAEPSLTANSQNNVDEIQERSNSGPSDAIFYAIAITMGVSCLSAAYAVGKVGAAALGAAAEKPELLGRAIIFVGLGEGIAIFGLIIALMLINRI